ncbi:CDKN2A-interacting protein isoform X1 [Sarcophilus harrisii]|uniref:CDKN2A interacting protein n=1 Tax=Sarcophilus harrisii TaxID=9305 RepID=A0A7N4NXM3_SARHA|nr:CDKN2A-interacting protein isoform X1 [Sarcophilus harrisii]
MARAAISEVSEYLSQNPRVAAWVETLRSDGETDKHWRHRREFLLRNAGDLAPTATTEAASVECGDRRRQLQQLVSSSMAWANHIFLGCRYPPKVMDKILSMAEGIKVTDAPIHTTRDELVAKVKKRGISSSNDGVEEPCKKRAVEGKSSSTSIQDALKTCGKTEQASPKQEVKVGAVPSIRPVGENINRSSSSTLERGSTLSQEGLGVKNKSTSEPALENFGKQNTTSNTSTSQVIASAPEKLSDIETSDKPATILISSVTTSNMNSVGIQLIDPKQNASPKKTISESTSSLCSQSASETELPLLSSHTRSETTSLPLLGSPTSSEVELPLLSSKPSSELLPLLGSKTTSDGSPSQSTSKTNLDSSISSKNNSSTSVQILTPKSTSSASTLLLPSKSSSQVAATLLAPKGNSPATSLLSSKSSSQTSVALLATKSSLTSVNPLASKSSSQTSTSQLPSKSSLQSCESSVRFSCKLTTEDVKQKQPFFNRLYKTVAWKLVAVGGFSPSVNHGELLNASVEALKATLDVSFVPLKELADLPQNKSSQESIVCELRCKSVYLGTGCGKSKENAKAVASREALKLFLKKKVVVKICKRKYRGSEIEDLVLLDEESRPTNLPPALKHPQELP